MSGATPFRFRQRRPKPRALEAYPAFYLRYLLGKTRDPVLSDYIRMALFLAEEREAGPPPGPPPGSPPGFPPDLAQALDVLGLTCWPCTAAEVRAAYRRLARERHPDTGGTHEAFLALREAYERVRRGLRESS